LLTGQPDYKPVGPIKTGRGRAGPCAMQAVS